MVNQVSTMPAISPIIPSSNIGNLGIRFAKMLSTKPQVRAIKFDLVTVINFFANRCISKADMPEITAARPHIAATNITPPFAPNFGSGLLKKYVTTVAQITQGSHTANNAM